MDYRLGQVAFAKSGGAVNIEAVAEGLVIFGKGMSGGTGKHVGLPDHELFKGVSRVK